VPDVVEDSDDDPVDPADPDRLRKVRRDSVAVGVAVGTSGLTFGAAGVAAGLTVWQCAALSLLVFTGASQFALVGVLGGGGSALAGALSAVALGVRNTFYGIRLADALHLSGFRRLLSAQIVIDESAAMATTQPTRRESRVAFFATGLAVYVVWNLATVVGAIGAGQIGDPMTFGVDAAAPAAFLALIAPRLRGRVERRTGALAVAIALVAVPLTPVGVPVLLAALAVLPVALGRRNDA
jgi:predicted branched-subunit amino acid permease